MTVMQKAGQHVLALPIDDVFPNLAQPRKSLERDELDRMAASVAARGILQPIRVRWDASRDCWEIVTGETRWRAARQAGLATVPALPVTGELSETDMLADQIIENVIRNDLRPMELARGLAKLKALKKCTSQQLAAELGITGARICRAESLLSLPAAIQTLVDSGSIPESAAYELSRLPDETTMQRLAQEVATGRLNRDQLAEAVRGRVGQRKAAPKASRLSCKLAGGVTFSLTAGEPLDWETLISTIERIRKEAKRLCDGGKDISELARLLRPS